MKLMRSGYYLLIAGKLGMNQSSWVNISCLAWFWYSVGPVMFGLRVKKRLVSCPQRLQEDEGVRLRRGGWACDYTGVQRGEVERGLTSQHPTWPTPGKLPTPLWASRPSEYRSHGHCLENYKSCAHTTSTQPSHGHAWVSLFHANVASLCVCLFWKRHRGSDGSTSLGGGAEPPRSGYGPPRGSYGPPSGGRCRGGRLRP